MIPIARPIVDNEEIEAVTRVLQSRMLAEGSVSREFESEYKKYVSTKFATVTTNGTTALSTALEALGIKPGAEVITTPFTFIASANTIAMTGAIPVFVDVKKDTYNLDPHLVEKAITEKTQAIMPVHIFGMPCEMPLIMEIAEKHDLLVIEDACQAHGATINGRQVGSFGHVAAFSFYATKNMMTGEGGIVVTNDEDLYDRMLAIKNHGRGKEGGYNHYQIGYNYRMLDLVAAIGIQQLKRLPDIVKAHRANAGKLNRFFSEYESVHPQVELPGIESSYHVYAPRFYSNKGDRDDIIQKLKDGGVSSRSVYALPCHKQRTYQNISEWRWAQFVKYPDYTSLSLPNSEEVGNVHFQIPIHPGVDDAAMDSILALFEKILS
ncbi:MAG: DegT/DnrJ/EryC1/StrS family aminotransferase [Candidatus Thorarchaeota archaeon]|nr:DegT/DnrJ/EryC1/StrS family aminotransferase [Candidatus Thorarchaeota archaeon]